MAAHVKMDDTRAFVPLSIGVLTVSDTRALEEDRSGDALVERLTTAGHRLAARAIVTDEVEKIRAVARSWIADGLRGVGNARQYACIEILARPHAAVILSQFLFQVHGCVTPANSRRRSRPRCSSVFTVPAGMPDIAATSSI